MGRRQEVLATLRRATGPQRITDLAAELDVHPNTVRFHLDALLASGQVERVGPGGRAGPGRPALLFSATRQMDPDGPRNYRLLAEALAATIGSGADPAAKARQAGRRWGSDLAGPSARALPTSDGVPELLGVLQDLGFAPERRRADGADQIGLRHCPFLELVGDHAQVICPLHLGLMEGVLAERGSPVQVTGLDPFAEPDLCLAHLDRN